MMVRANFAWIVTEDTRVLDQARAGIRHVLERAAAPAARPGRRPRRKRSPARA
jgi:hypothetical protein